MLASNPFSKTSLCASERTNRWNRPVKAGGSRNVSLRVYEAPAASPPTWSNSASTMSSPSPAMAFLDAMTASVHVEVRPAPVPRLVTVQPTVTFAGSWMVSVGALIADVSRSA